MVAGSSSKFPGPSESGEVRGSKRLNTDTRDNVLISSANAVMSNDDLLTEILLLLPAISLFLYKSVSKQWLSVITCPTFSLRLSQKPNIDPPSGLFVWGPICKSKRNMFEYDFISFDTRIPSKISIVCSLNEILQSCNGLLLCYIDPDEFYVYNPCVNLFKMLPQPHTFNIVDGIKLVFDPRKSPHYKVVNAGVKTDVDFDDYDVDGDGDGDGDGGFYIQIETYSSKTGSWSVCDNRFPLYMFNGFVEGIYSNGAIHWLHFEKYVHVKLDILVDHPVLSTMQLPLTLYGKLFSDHNFFESRGFLLLVCKDSPDSRQLNIFEMSNGYSEWSLKYLVNLDDIMMPFPQDWMIRSSVWCIVLGERDEDTFMVIVSYEKVLQYKILLKTVHTLFDLKSTNPYASFPSPFTASFAVCDSNSGSKYEAASRREK